MNVTDGWIHGSVNVFHYRRGFHWTEVPFKTDFSVFCCFQVCYWRPLYSVYEMWCYRHGDSGGFTFLHFASNGEQKGTAVSAVSTQQYISTRPHGVTSKDIVIFMFTVARTLKPPKHWYLPAKGGGDTEAVRGQAKWLKNLYSKQKKWFFVHNTS